MELRCEGSGKASKLLSRTLCTQIDTGTVEVVADTSLLAGGGAVHFMPGVAGLAVDVHARGQQGADDAEFLLRFVNEAEPKDEVRIYWMKSAGQIGHLVRSLPGGGSGAGVEHREVASPGSLFRLTTRPTALGPEFERCGRAAHRAEGAEYCTSWEAVVQKALEERRYAEVISLYELLGNSCIVASNPANSANDLIPRVYPEADVSSAKLRHEASHLRYLVARERADEELGLQLAAHFEHVAKVVDSAFGSDRSRITLREMYSHPDVKKAMEQLEPENATISVACHLNRRVKGTVQRDWGGASVLHTSTDFGRVLEDFWTKGVAIIDDVLSPEALEEFQHYILEEARYTKVRTKYMEASPPSFQPRVLASLARELEARLPEVFNFSDIHLQRWWAFQQVDSDEQPGWSSRAAEQAGVDMHADAAMVSLNLFATPDEARLSGGGLHIWRVLPGSKTGFDSYNKMNWDKKEKAKILAFNKETVPYKYNRAALFMSDLFHETENFEFRPGHHHQRVNVAVLWGQKQPSGTLFGRRPKQFMDTTSIPHLEL